MPTYHFTLTIPAEDYLRYYQGRARQVVVETVEGITLRFPASRLVRFVTHNGIHGEFRLECDEANKFVELECIGSSTAPDRQA
jgi:hypothetical protein